MRNLRIRRVVPTSISMRVAIAAPAWLVAVVLATGVIGCGSTGNLARPPITPGSVRMPDIRMPPGEWTATGTVLRAVNSADEPVGTRLVRSWTFSRICDPRCQTVFLRQTLYGPSKTVVVAHHGLYTAAFPPVTVPCAHYPGEDAGTAQSYDTYTLWWSHDRRQIIAREQNHSVSQNCPGAQTNRWVATRTDPTLSVPATGP